MTLTQALDKLAAELDAGFAQRQDANWLRMIECGVSAGDTHDALEDARDQYRTWRAQTLGEMRQWLLDDAHVPTPG